MVVVDVGGVDVVKAIVVVDVRSGHAVIPVTVLVKHSCWLKTIVGYDHQVNNCCWKCCCCLWWRFTYQVLLVVAVLL